uniref:B30.2/SPRY domain-containing protein n=1 Tax=Parastrongyloides trichosuri TaxID=131310 RepID=A0A0N4ZKM0_PARTI
MESESSMNGSIQNIDVILNDDVQQENRQSPRNSFLIRNERMRHNVLEFIRSHYYIPLFSIGNVFEVTRKMEIKKINYDPVDVYDADVCCPYKFKVIKDSELPPQSVMEEYAWNPNDRSLNIYVREDDPLTFHRRSRIKRTDGIRGKIGFCSGFHVWEINWPTDQRGTNAVIGVATSEEVLHADTYMSLVGSSNESYGWDIVNLMCSTNHNNNDTWEYPDTEWKDYRDETNSNTVPETIYCILDMDEGYMAFATKDDYLGVAFRNLKGKTLYPMVSAVWGHCEVTMKYRGSFPPETPSLLFACKKSIRKHFGKENMHKILCLDIPMNMIDYLL